jgi:hypothetical protein
MAVNVGVVNELELVPTGCEVSPEVPWYHWYESDAVPVAVTVNVAVCPLWILWPRGCEVIEGEVQVAAETLIWRWLSVAVADAASVTLSTTV